MSLDMNRDMNLDMKVDMIQGIKEVFPYKDSKRKVNCNFTSKECFNEWFNTIEYILVIDFF